MGLAVYRTATPNTRVHRDQDCWRLRRNARSAIYELDLATLSAPQLCRSCFPEAPRVKVFHGLCRACDRGRPYPCEHNGGVRVMVEQHDGVGANKPGHPEGRLQQLRWVWPENAHHYVMAPQVL